MVRRGKGGGQRREDTASGAATRPWRIGRGSCGSGGPVDGRIHRVSGLTAVGGNRRSVPGGGGRPKEHAAAAAAAAASSPCQLSTDLILSYLGSGVRVCTNRYWSGRRVVEMYRVGSCLPCCTNCATVASMGSRMRLRKPIRLEHAGVSALPPRKQCYDREPLRTIVSRAGAHCI